jgi:hypothetical protein
LPVRSKPSAVARPKTKPEQTACRSNAAPKRVVGRRGREHDQVDRLCVDARVGNGSACGGKRQIGRVLSRRGDVALTDAGPLHDPFVRRVDGFREILIGEDALGQIAAAAEHDRTHDTHVPTSPTACGSRGA